MTKKKQEPGDVPPRIGRPRKYADLPSIAAKRVRRRHQRADQARRRGGAVERVRDFTLTGPVQFTPPYLSARDFDSTAGVPTTEACICHRCPMLSLELTMSRSAVTAAEPGAAPRCDV